MPPRLPFRRTEKGVQGNPQGSTGESPREYRRIGKCESGEKGKSALMLVACHIPHLRDGQRNDAATNQSNTI